MKILKATSVFSLLLLGYLLFFANGVLAVEYKLEMPLPGAPSTISSPAQYIQYFFIFGLSLIGFLAVAALAVGGIMWMIGGSITSTEKAKNIIVGAVSGVVLLLCSYLLLYTIDPSLTNLTPRVLQKVVLEEAPSAPDTGTVVEARLNTEIGFKSNYMLQDFQNGKMNGTLASYLNALPVPITVTETTHDHGCFPGDDVAPGAAAGTSAHCSGRAVDIRISDKNSQQLQQILQTLSQDKCTSEIFYAGLPQYCRVNGQPASSSGSCQAHSNHIHYSVKANCS